MKLAVVGSRDFQDFDLLCKELDAIHYKKKVTLMVSGGAKGADSLAERWALERGVPTKIFLPEWEKFGRAAAIARNRLIVEHSDECIAFWNGHGRGTKSTIDIAKKKGSPLRVVLFAQPL